MVVLVEVEGDEVVGVAEEEDDAGTVVEADAGIAAADVGIAAVGGIAAGVVVARAPQIEKYMPAMHQGTGNGM